jgi:hypothetical protein
VQNLLQKVRPEWTNNSFETVELATHGDMEKELHMRALGQGAFTEVIDQAVAEGAVDIGVHSLKDSPVVLPQGVQLAACLARDDPRSVAWVHALALDLCKNHECLWPARTAYCTGCCTMLAEDCFAMSVCRGSAKKIDFAIVMCVISCTCEALAFLLQTAPGSPLSTNSSNILD